MKPYLQNFFDNPSVEGYSRVIDLDGTCNYLKTEDLKKLLLEDMERIKGLVR